ncbi:MAG: DUF3418 domain-containing protein, partial [Candidatus Aminicenantes bacterium]|nr:DUF3418 domain-containing protein [Candidatus Aminicenantes bacterium]
ARIDPEWLEALGGDLCRYSHAGAHWDKDRGEVVALERVTLYGLEIVSGRRVSYGRIDPEEARRIFIQTALVEGKLHDPPPFLEHNIKLVERLAQIEEKLRRRGYLAGEEALAEFYTLRLPGLCDERSLRKYIKDRGGDAFLKMSENDLLQMFPDEKELSGFPDHLAIGEMRLPLTYRFAPGEKDDGATLKAPLFMIKDISQEALQWGVPGQFREKIESLVKGLPKRYRKLLVPVSEKAEIIFKEIEPKEDSLYKTLTDFVRRRFQLDIPESAWAEAAVPSHLRIRISVIGPEEEELEASRDLESLKQKKWPAATPPSSDRWTRAREEWERTGLNSWDFGALPEEVPIGPFVTAYPALEPAEGGANIRLFSELEQARESHRKGVRSLLFLRFQKDLKFLKQYLVVPEELRNQALYFGGREAIEKAMMEALQKEALEKNIRSPEEFQACTEHMTKDLFAISHALGEAVRQILPAYNEVRSVLKNIAQSKGDSQAVKRLIGEAKYELDDLVPKDFPERYALERLKHMPRYLEALSLRIERGAYNPVKDSAKARQVAPFVKALDALQGDTADGSDSRISIERRIAVDEFRWMIEEFKVSLFAPELKTAYPISPKRLLAKLKELK